MEGALLLPPTRTGDGQRLRSADRERARGPHASFRAQHGPRGGSRRPISIKEGTTLRERGEERTPRSG